MVAQPRGAGNQCGTSCPFVSCHERRKGLRLWWIRRWHKLCLRGCIQGFPMAKTHCVSHSRAFVAGILAAAALVAASATPAGAQSHRARLARDLAERLAQRIEAATEVIVDVPDAQIDLLTARYGVRLKKRLHGSGVFEATGGQIEALSQDPDVAHISGNNPVFRMMAVTAVATGADQVWSGLEQFRGVTGQGVGIAVIDSGIAVNHAALRGRVVATVDFIDR